MSVRSLLCLSVIAIAINGELAHADEASPFIIGADISWVQQQEAEGKTWSDDGEQKDIFASGTPAKTKGVGTSTCSRSGKSGPRSHERRDGGTEKTGNNS